MSDNSMPQSFSTTISTNMNANNADIDNDSTSITDSVGTLDQQIQSFTSLSLTKLNLEESSVEVNTFNFLLNLNLSFG
jgi:hypothetical protein